MSEFKLVGVYEKILLIELYGDDLSFVIFELIDNEIGEILGI